jgi:hypothetical protein
LLLAGAFVMPVIIILCINGYGLVYKRAILAGMTNKRESDMFTLFFIVLWAVLFIAIGEALLAIYKEPLIKESLVYASLVTAFVWLAVYNFG